MGCFDMCRRRSKRSEHRPIGDRQLTSLTDDGDQIEGRRAVRRSSRRMEVSHTQIQNSSEEVLEETDMKTCIPMDTSKVDEWDFETLIRWFEENKIPYDEFETEEELKLFVKQKTLKMPNASTSFYTMMNIPEQREAFEKANRLRTDLERVFIDLRQLTIRLDQAIPYAKTAKLELYRRQLPHKMDDLKCKEYHFLVLGETSSGKSSFINLLAGVELLPTAFLAESLCICCLHNSPGAYFVLEYTDPKRRKMRVDVKNNQDMPKKLAESISRKEANLSLKKVDVYFPIPFLPDNMTIVDSPGIGESDELTEQVLQFMRAAVGLIYIVDSSNAGGIQPDKLCYLLEEQKRMEQTENEREPFDFSQTVVILNKWDIVEENDQEREVFQQTKDTLSELMGSFETENIFTMSIGRELRWKKLGLIPSEKCLQMFQSINKVLPKTVTAKFVRHTRWLDGFLYSIHEYLNSFKKSTSSSKHEMIKFKQDVQTKMETLQMMSIEIKKELDFFSQQKCETVAEALHSYLTTPEVQKRFLDWRKEKHPKRLIEDSTEEDLRREINKRMCTKLHSILLEWEAKHHILTSVFKELEGHRREKIISIQKLCQKLNADFGQDTDSDFSAFLYACKKQNIRYSEPDDITISTGAKVAIAVTSPIWVPVGLAVAIVGVPSALAVSGIRGIKLKLTYAKTEFQKMLYKESKEVAKNLFTRSNLQVFVAKTYFESFDNKTRDIFLTQVEREIEDKKMLIQIKESEIKNATLNLITLDELMRKFEGVRQKLNTVKSVHFT